MQSCIYVTYFLINNNNFVSEIKFLRKTLRRIIEKGKERKSCTIPNQNIAKMQSVLFKNRNISFLRQYLQATRIPPSKYNTALIQSLTIKLKKKPFSSARFKQFFNSNILKPLASGSSHLNEHFPFETKSILYFKKSSPKAFEDPFSGKKQSSDGKQQESSNEDDEKKKRDLFQKRIALFTMALAFFLLNLSYLQEVAEMQKKIDAKDRELQEEKKRKALQIAATDPLAQGANYGEQTIVPIATAAPSTDVKVKSTLITWSEFVSEYLAKGNVIELIANRNTDLVLIR